MSQPDQKLIESVLKSTVEGGKYVLGVKEVLGSLKGVRLVVYAAFAPQPTRTQVAEACVAASVPAFVFQGTPLELGRVCRKPFRVTAIAARTTGSMDISPLLGQGEKAVSM